jgi:hypothetical protein
MAYTLLDLANDIIHNRLWNIPGVYKSLADDIIHNHLRNIQPDSLRFAEDVIHDNLWDISSGFRPIDVSGCILWLSADSGVTKDETDHVSLWKDQSNEGNDVFAVADLPVWIDDQVNHHPVISMDYTLGSSCFFLTDRFVESFSGTRVPMDIFMVLKPNAQGYETPFGNLLSIEASGSAAKRQIHQYLDEILPLEVDDSGGEIVYDFLYSLLDTYYILEYYNDGVYPPEWELRVNSVSISGAEAEFGSFGQPETYDGGSGSYGDVIAPTGYLAEYIVNTTISNGDRTKIRNYLNDKYNIY